MFSCEVKTWIEEPTSELAVWDEHPSGHPLFQMFANAIVQVPMRVAERRTVDVHNVACLISVTCMDYMCWQLHPDVRCVDKPFTFRDLRLKVILSVFVLRDLNGSGACVCFSTTR